MNRSNQLTALLVIGFAGNLAPPASAEVMLGVGPAVDLGVGGLKQYTVSAVGTDDEFINVFGLFNLTGSVHQVGALGSPWSPTTTVDAHAGMGFDTSWSPFDTHWLFPRQDMVGQVGTPLAEENDLSTTGTLRLAPRMGIDAPSGFGEFATPDGAFGLLPGVASSNVAFLQVVTNSSASLDVQISFMDHTRSIANSIKFGEIPIGTSDVATTFAGTLRRPPEPDPPAPPVPDPPSDPVVELPHEPVADPPPAPCHKAPVHKVPVVDVPVVEPPVTEVPVVDVPVYAQPIPIGERSFEAGAIIDIDWHSPIQFELVNLPERYTGGWVDYASFATDGLASFHSAGGTPLTAVAALVGHSPSFGSGTVPEPASIALVGLAVVGMAGCRRRRWASS